MKKFILISVSTVLLILIVFRVVIINQKYPDVIEQSYTTREKVPYKTFELTVLDYYLLDKETLNTLFNEEIRVLGEYQCMIVDLHIKNIDAKEQVLNVYTFILETGAAKNGINLNAFYALNGEKATLSPQISANETIVLKLPFHFTEKNFTKSKWIEFSQRDFSLVLNLYPKKLIINL
ncbi:MAG: hypothetical protein E7568_00050 [Ruminococcaceae bacterium]|nr:hypothetical protein [Oscillospiraceae bacterium]